MPSLTDLLKDELLRVLFGTLVLLVLGQLWAFVGPIFDGWRDFTW